MIIIPPSGQAGTAGKPGSKFTGDVFPYLTMARTNGVTINNVSFAPGAHTFWHSHQHGQILQVLAGRGLIQAFGGGVRTIRAGDTIWASPGEQHWHGAAPDSYLTHIAISLGVTTWAEEVAEGDYPTLPSEQEH